MPDYNSDTFYALTPIREWVVKEIENREKDFGFSTADSILKYDGSTPYKGPKSAWVRVVSNAQVSLPVVSGNGFQLFTQDGFDKIYGFGNSGNSFTQGVIGYDIFGNEYTLPNTMPNLHRPPPGVLSLSTETLGGDGGKYKKATVKASVSSKFQLDYLTPFFLVPGITCFVEWGWNNFNPASSINVSSDEERFKRFENPLDGNAAQEKSNGNYDSIFGRITNYEYSLRSDGGFDISFDILQVGEAIHGLKMKTVKTEPKKNEDDNQSQSFPDYIDKNLINIIDNEKYQEFSKPFDVKGRVITEKYWRETHTLSNNETSIPGKGKWLSFGLFVDIVNSFINYTSNTGVDKSKTTDMFKIVIDKINDHPSARDEYISATPNLKTIDASILLIPNEKAPSLNFTKGGKEEFENGFVETLGDDEFAEAKKSLQSIASENGTGLSTKRVNLSNLFDSNPISGKPKFPEYSQDLTVDGKLYVKKGYYGKLSDLFISSELVLDAVSGNSSFKGMLMYILSKMSAAACNIWDFSIVPLDPSQGSNGIHTIRDSNLATNISLFRDKLYTFNPLSSNSVIKNLTFGINLPDSVATQTMLSSRTKNGDRDEYAFHTQVRGTSITDPMINKLLLKDEVKKKIESNTVAATKTIEPNLYCKLKIKNSTIKFAEPNDDIMRNLITSDKNLYNSAIYNGLVPGVEVEIEMLGISGLKFLDVFSLNGISDAYSKNAVYQVKNVKHQISDHMWTTTITAGLRPFPEVLAFAEIETK